MNNVLFVCTGNTCRSPMAMAIYNSLGFGCAFSRGLSASGAPASENAKKAVKKYGASLEDHISKQISYEDIKKSEIVLTMTKAHCDFLKSVFEEDKKKIMTLSEYAGEECDIPDPFGGDEDVYSYTADRIYELLIKAENSKTITFANEGDADIICELEEKCFDDPWSKNSVKEKIAKKSVIDITNDDCLYGYCIFSNAADEGEILRIAVDENKRGQGLGKELLKKAVDIMKKRGAESIYLEVKSSNKNAVSLYEKSGFEKIGERKGYYQNGENAVLYTLKTKDRL